MLVKTTMSNFTLKIAASIIIGVILTFFGLGVGAISSKVDKEAFEKQCRENERRFHSLEKQDKDRQIENKEIIDLLHKLEIKVTRVEVNTDRLLENERKQKSN